MANFRLGETVYVVGIDSERETCYRCGGNGYIEKPRILRKPIRERCQYCNGRGCITIKSYFIPVETEITAIKTLTEKTKSITAFIVGDSLFWYNIDEIYRTKEECQVACDEFNREEATK